MNVSRKCVPGARTSDRECTIAHPRPRARVGHILAITNANTLVTFCDDSFI